MSQIPTPSATPAPDTLPDRAHAHASISLELDTLLERYLHLLDQHQTLQAQLSKQLSGGFFSLAQANFAAPGRGRYGQDHYDERMKAGRRISLQPSDEEAGACTFHVNSPPGASPPELKKEEPGGEKYETSQKDPVAETEEELTALSIAKSKPKQRDPLRWFGILVPPALRAAQKSFIAALEDSVPGIATVMAEMRHVEAEVARLRSKMESSNEKSSI